MTGQETVAIVAAGITVGVPLAAAGVLAVGRGRLAARPVAASALGIVRLRALLFGLPARVHSESLGSSR